MVQSDAGCSVRVKILIVILAGLAHAASVAWPFTFLFNSGQPLWGLQLVALATLVWQIRTACDAKKSAWLGWCFASAWLCATFWWLFISMHQYGGLPAPWSALAVAALAGVLALYYAAACAAYSAIGPLNASCAAIIFAALWTGAELARACWFTGFPWGAGGYAHVDGPLGAYVSWVGVYGVGAGAAFLAAILQQFRVCGYPVQVTAALVLVAPVLLPFKTHSSPAGFFSVTLLQGNIAQDQKFNQRTGVVLALPWYRQQLQQAQSQLIVTPETALPLSQRNDGFILRHGQAAFLGVPVDDPGRGYTNAVLAQTSQGLGSYRYDKHHLVPFGEFIPPLFKWFVNLMHIPLGDFNQGALNQPSFAWQGQRLAPNICYEDLFGEELGTRFIDPASAPTALVNLSNIAWFGNTIAIDQHLNISRMRALEFERPMLRATNTGATAIIDHQGRVTHSLARHTRGALVGEVQGRNGITPYAWWVSRFGLWPLWLLASAIVLIASYSSCMRHRAKYNLP